MDSSPPLTEKFQRSEPQVSEQGGDSHEQQRGDLDWNAIPDHGAHRGRPRRARSLDNIGSTRNGRDAHSFNTKRSPQIAGPLSPLSRSPPLEPSHSPRQASPSPGVRMRIKRREISPRVLDHYEIPYEICKDDHTKLLLERSYSYDKLKNWCDVTDWLRAHPMDAAQSEPLKRPQAPRRPSYPYSSTRPSYLPHHPTSSGTTRSTYSGTTLHGLRNDDDDDGPIERNTRPRYRILRKMVGPEADDELRPSYNRPYVPQRLTPYSGYPSDSDQGKSASYTPYSRDPPYPGSRRPSELKARPSSNEDEGHGRYSHSGAARPSNTRPSDVETGLYDSRSLHPGPGRGFRRSSTIFEDDVPSDVRRSQGTHQIPADRPYQYQQVSDGEEPSRSKRSRSGLQRSSAVSNRYYERDGPFPPLKNNLNFGRRYHYGVKLLQPDIEKKGTFNSVNRAGTFERVRPSFGKPSKYTYNSDCRFRHSTSHILQSFYVHPNDDSDHGAAHLISSGTDGSSQSRGIKEAQFRWLHVDTDLIDWETFQRVVTEQSALRSAERTLVTQLLEEVARTCEKRTAYGKYLLPTVVKYEGKGNQIIGGDHTVKSAIFMCLPYFSMEPLHKQRLVKDSALHQPRALLQTCHHVESTWQMDEKQTIRRNGGGRDRVHVPQFWCIILESTRTSPENFEARLIFFQETLITCAPMSMSNLRGSLIRDDSMAPSDRTSKGPRYIKITSDRTDEDDFFPIQKTWFELMELLGTHHYYLDGREELLTKDGIVVSDRNWTSSLESEKNTLMELTIRRKPMQLRLLPPPPSYEPGLRPRESTLDDGGGMSERLKRTRPGRVRFAREDSYDPGPQLSDSDISRRSFESSESFGNSKTEDAKVFTTSETDISEKKQVHQTELPKNSPSLPTKKADQRSLGSSPIFTWPVKGDNISRAINGVTTGEEGEDPNFSPKIATQDSERLSKRVEDADRRLKVLIQESPYENDFAAMEKSSKKDVDVLILAMDREFTRNDNGRQSCSWSELRELTELISYAIEAFIPTNFHAPLSDSCWGALKVLIEIIRQAQNHPSDHLKNYFEQMGEQFVEIVALIEQIQNGVSGASSSGSDTKFYLPRSLRDAFQRLVMCLYTIHRVKNEPEHIQSIEGDAWSFGSGCAKSLRKGKDDLIKMIHTGRFDGAEEIETVDVKTITAILLERLVQNCDTKRDLQLLDEYRGCMTRLEKRVLEAPRVAVFDDIQSLVEELETINGITAQQLVVTETIEHLFATSLPGYGLSRDLLMVNLLGSKNYLQQQGNDIDDLLELASNRKTLLRHKLDLRKESNSLTVFIFTVVTTIFLPLSFVASYLGMNSIDIRNAGFSQSRFWEISIPLTILVLIAVWLIVEWRKRLKKRPRLNRRSIFQVSHELRSNIRVGQRFKRIIGRIRSPIFQRMYQRRKASEESIV